jgi:hypothetical protein
MGHAFAKAMNRKELEAPGVEGGSGQRQYIAETRN